MNIGYACIPLTIDAKTTRKVTLKNFTEEKFLKIVHENLLDLKRILRHNSKNNINLFRISSDIIPLGSHEINDINWNKHFKHELDDIGNFIRNSGMRVSMHPGQYTVLNSNKNEVVEKAVKDLEYHCRFLDALDLDSKHKIILHIGGVYGDKKEAARRFITNYKELSPNIKKRLVIENDDRNFNIEDVIGISEEAGIPVVFDNLHHKCNYEGEEKIEDILCTVKKTWKEEDGPMKLHYSQQSIDNRRGAHSEYIKLKEFMEYYNKIVHFNPDIMLEVKNKDISAIKCINAVLEKKGELNKSVLIDEWEKYKYAVMERNYEFYRECSVIVKDKCSIFDFYLYIDKVLQEPIDFENFLSAADHIWEYVKCDVSSSEKDKFNKLLKDSNMNKIRNFLNKLIVKYNVDHMKKSYYFSIKL